jgi:cell shape-determining protein MreC
MKQEALKSKTDPKKLLVFAFISAFLLITNVTGWNNIIYSDVDTVLNPFLVVGHNVAFNTDLLFREIGDKSGVLRENIDLKREITEYEELNAINKDLRDQIARLQQQAGVTVPENRNFRLVKVIGVQNLYASDPELLIYLDSGATVKQWDVVYYDNQTLFGFVKEINGRTAKIVPFFSPDINFNIPVQSTRDPTQKGFISKISNAKVEIRNVSKDVGVSEGDVWVTTNDVTEVPSSLVVGRISKVSKEAQESFQSLEIDAPFNLSATTYLMMEQ